MPYTRLLFRALLVYYLYFFRPQFLETISGFQRLREIGTFQMTHNGMLVSIDGFSGLQRGQVTNLYLNNNRRLCFILGELSDREYWMVSGIYVTID